MKPKSSVLGHEDADEYHKLMEAMKTLGFKDVELRETFKLLAALLQIGNFEFEEAMIDNLDACHLIYNSGVKPGCQSFLNSSQFQDFRDFKPACYDWLKCLKSPFDWLMP